MVVIASRIRDGFQVGLQWHYDRSAEAGHALKITLGIVSVAVYRPGRQAPEGGVIWTPWPSDDVRATYTPKGYGLWVRKAAVTT